MHRRKEVVGGGGGGIFNSVLYFSWQMIFNGQFMKKWCEMCFRSRAQLCSATCFTVTATWTTCKVSSLNTRSVLGWLHQICCSDFHFFFLLFFFFLLVHLLLSLLRRFESAAVRSWSSVHWLFDISGGNFFCWVEGRGINSSYSFYHIVCI